MTDADWLRAVARQDYTVDGRCLGTGVELIAVAARMDIAEATCRAQREEAEGAYAWIERAERLLRDGIRDKKQHGAWGSDFEQRVETFLKTPSESMQHRVSRLAEASRLLSLCRAYMAVHDPANARKIFGATVASEPTLRSERESPQPSAASSR